MADLLITSDTTLELLDTGVSELLEVATQGPQGPAGPQGAAGPAGGSVNTVAIAAEALGGHRATVINALGQAQYASNTTPEHFGRFAGITTNAAVQGDSVTLQDAGVCIEPSWTWVPNAPLYLSVNGILTQTPPTTGFMQVLGVALSATSIFINPREPLAII